jgi:hypothetical protein
MSTEKEVDMIFLDTERAYHPGTGFADTADFLFDKRSQLANENLLPILRTLNKMKKRK